MTAKQLPTIRAWWACRSSRRAAAMCREVQACLAPVQPRWLTQLKPEKTQL